jgi:hypothetical protein
MELIVDADLKKVAEFMQTEIPAGKLISVSEQIPKVARLLWSQFPQESCIGAVLTSCPITNGLLPASNESVPVLTCVGDDSEVEA